MEKYIDLKRCFIDYSNSTDPESAAQQSYINAVLGEDANTYWNDLLESKYVVVLGEAGSGKSWEFRAQYELLKSKGKFAFFLRLENLVEGSLSSAIDSLDETLFQEWRESEESATFFLDSVDEAKLKNHNALHEALNHFVKGIGQDSTSRTNIAISCRISEWRDSADKTEVIRRFNIPLNNENSNAALKIVLLAPLNETQLRQLAEAKDIPNSNDFIQAVIIQSALEFASRPLDAELLIEYWKTFHHLGNRQELLEYSIPKKLSERTERKLHNLLTPVKARAGAETLAAAAILCKKFNILVPDTDIPNDSDALDIQVLLPDWLTQERSALLGLPVFDGATYGHIRFHHRTTTEYLCACWLQQRMCDQLPYPYLEDILFMQVHDRWMVRPAMLAISTWLATLGENFWNKRVRSFLLKHNPESFLQFGEPRNLKTDVLKQLLQSLISRYEGRQDVRLSTENYQLLALAQLELADELAAIIQDESISNDIRIDLIQAIWHGNLPQCNNALLNIIDSNDAEYIKRYAVTVLSDLANKEQLERLHTIAKQYIEIPSMLCAYLCEALYPKTINPIELISLIEKVSPHKDWSSLDISYYLEQLFINNEIPVFHYEDLLKGFIRLCKKEPYIKEGSKVSNVSVEFAWLGDALLQILIKILCQKGVDKILIPQISEAVISLNYINRFQSLSHRADKELSRLNQLLLLYPDIREDYFWSIINQKHKNNDQVYRASIFGYSDVINADKSDIEWLINNIKNPESEFQQEQALRLAIQLRYRVILPKDTKKRLRKAISGNRTLIRVLNNELPNHVISTYRRIKRKLLDRYFWKSIKQKFTYRISKFYRSIFNWIWLRSHIKGIRSGNHFGTLYKLAHRSTSKEDAIYQLHRWENLVPLYGQGIAKAARDGWIIFWRSYKPELTKKTDGVEVGLAGIRAEQAKNSELLSTISDADAELMTRYATHSLNNYPDWLLNLAEIKPKAVQSIINKCIEIDWGYPTSELNYHGTISRLQYAPSILQDLAIQKLQVMLKNSDPTHPRVLSIVLEILLQNTTSNKAFLAIIARERLNHPSYDQASIINWLSLLLQIDGLQGVELLKQELNKPEADADDLLLKLSAQLDPRHGSLKLVSPRSSYKTAQCLRILIPIVYKHIRISDDIHRSGGGAYSPNRRDFAQSFREELLPWIAGADESSTFQLLTELLEEPELKDKQDFILHLMDKRAERDSDLAAWMPTQVHEFEKEHESQPRSNHDLFKLVCWRLQSIKDHVERDDYSPREIFNKKSLESMLRKWLSKQLQSRAKGKYSEAQEVEVDLGKKPDIRLLAPNINPISIEIKWADNWTIKELEDALTTQLVGQYLRTPDSNYGAFLLGYRGKKQCWVHAETKVRFNLQNLVSHLQKLANNIEEQDVNVLGLKIVGIDFTEPNFRKGSL